MKLKSKRQCRYEIIIFRRNTKRGNNIIKIKLKDNRFKNHVDYNLHALHSATSHSQTSLLSSLTPLCITFDEINSCFYCDLIKECSVQIILQSSDTVLIIGKKI